MKELYIKQIAELNEFTIKDLINCSFEFYLNSKSSVLNTDFLVGKIVGYDLTIEKKIFNLVIQLKEGNDNFELPILKIGKMKYVC